MNRLNELSFIDLILEDGFAEIKGMKGASAYLTDLPEIYQGDASELRNVCNDIHIRTQKTEFSLRYDGRIYRVTVIYHEWSGTSFVIRQTPENILPFTDVPLSTPLRSSITRPGATGLCLIAGEMGSGKTTTAASVLRQRIEITGSLGVSIE
ncbi:conjugal transfer protein, partial [Salmonella enterica]|nr:conjugal transfer protein [Salmonella enterica]